MRWISPIATRVKDAAIDRILRNHDERIRQIVKHLSQPEEVEEVSTETVYDEFTDIFMPTGIAMTSAGVGLVDQPVSAGFDYAGRWDASGVGDILVIPIRLHVGDKIKQVVYRYFGGNGSTKRFSLISGSTTGTRDIHETDTAVLSGANPYTQTVSPVVEIVSGSAPWAQFRTGHADDSFYFVEVTYDRPRPE